MKQIDGLIDSFASIGDLRRALAVLWVDLASQQSMDTESSIVACLVLATEG